MMPRRGNLINNNASDTNYDAEKRLQIVLSQDETNRRKRSVVFTLMALKKSPRSCRKVTNGKRENNKPRERE